MDQEARKMARRLGTLAALAGDDGLAPSTCISSSSRGSRALKDPLGHQHSHAQTHTYAHNKKYEKRWSN